MATPGQPTSYKPEEVEQAVASALGSETMTTTGGTGSEVMQRIAVPMIGGMASSALLTLLVIPVIYALAKGWCLVPTTQSTGSVAASA